MADGPKLQVLVVEDNPADAFRVREALESRGRGRFHPTFAKALKEAEAGFSGADVILLDLTLPDSAGADTVARVRAKAPGKPVVVLSGERDEAMAFRCLQHGAQDVLLKGAVDGDALVRAISCALERQALAKERDGALRKARAGEAELRRVLEALREGIVIADPCGRALFANPAAERLLGWQPGEGAGRVVDLPLGVGGVRDAGRPGPDGQPAALEVQTAAIRWEGIPATLTSIHEVGRRRPRERGGRESEDRRIAEDRREATRRFAGGVARALGENLAAVLEAAYELSDSHDVAAYGPALRIQRAGWQATTLVRQLLACAGEAKAMPENLDLSEVVASHWDRVEERLAGTVSSVTDLTPGLPRVRADRRLLEQALMALVEHARNAMPGGGTVTVRTELVPGPAPGPASGPGESEREPVLRAALSVSDTGPGLGSRACRRLFEPFYSTEVLGIGTGLGLALVHGIALQSGGTTEVESVPGKGTTVRLLLPVLGDGTAGVEGPGLEAIEGVGIPVPGGSETVLVAEGDPWLRGRITSTLKELGYRVLSAAGAGDAVRLAVSHRGPLPLLLAELRATGMGGAVLTGVLRCRRPGMRAILLTDSTGRDRRSRTASAGARFLERPFGREELARVVRSILDLPTEGSVSLDAPPGPGPPGPDPIPGRFFPPRSNDNF